MKGRKIFPNSEITHKSEIRKSTIYKIKDSVKYIVCDFFFCYSYCSNEEIVSLYSRFYRKDTIWRKETGEFSRKATAMKATDIRKIEAVIYAMADKFLENAELEELKEGMLL